MPSVPVTGVNSSSGWALAHCESSRLTVLRLIPVACPIEAGLIPISRIDATTSCRSSRFRCRRFTHRAHTTAQHHPHHTNPETPTNSPKNLQTNPRHRNHNKSPLDGNGTPATTLNTTHTQHQPGRVTTQKTAHTFDQQRQPSSPNTALQPPQNTPKTPPDQPISPYIGCYSKKLWNPYQKPPSCTWSSVMLNGAPHVCLRGPPLGCPR